MYNTNFNNLLFIILFESRWSSIYSISLESFLDDLLSYITLVMQCITCVWRNKTRFYFILHVKILQMILKNKWPESPSIHSIPAYHAKKTVFCIASWMVMSGPWPPSVRSLSFVIFCQWIASIVRRRCVWYVTRTRCGVP